MIDRHRKGLQAELLAHEYFIKNKYKVCPTCGNRKIEF